MFFENINYWAVLGATVGGMAVGFVWYSPWAFGKLWMAAKGWTEESMQAASAGKSMAPTYIATALGTLATAFVLAALFNSLIVVGFSGILLAAFVLWLGFAAPMKLNDHLFGGDSRTLFFISIGHELAALVVMSVIVGIFG